MLLLREADRFLGLSESMARALDDSRRRARCAHDGLSLLQQQVHGLSPGFEDFNDHETLRPDPAIQAALDGAVSNERGN